MRSRSSALAMGLALCAAPGLVQAADPSVENDARLRQAIGSTIVSTYPDGRQAELWLKGDGTYQAEGRRHDVSDGEWRVKDGKLCMRRRHPFPIPFSYCTPVPPSLDHPWTGKAPTGEAISIKLVKGPKGRDEDLGIAHKAGGEEGRTKTAG